jgi:hypothetical protein
MPTRNPPESFSRPYDLADQCLAVIGEVCFEKPIAGKLAEEILCNDPDHPVPDSQKEAVLLNAFRSAFSSNVQIVRKELALILPELESAITPEIEEAACRVSGQYYRLAGPRRNCALLAVKCGCAFILQAKNVFMFPSAPEDYASLADCQAVAWPARKTVEALRDALATEGKCVAAAQGGHGASDGWDKPDLPENLRMLAKALIEAGVKVKTRSLTHAPIHDHRMVIGEPSKIVGTHNKSKWKGWITKYIGHSRGLWWWKPAIAGK